MKLEPVNETNKQQTSNQQSLECAQRGELRPAEQQQLPAKADKTTEAVTAKEQKPVLAVSASVNTVPQAKPKV
ncbi:MAG: hypothetical protein ACO1OQ_01830 [Rufibacter sp.]